MLKPPQIAKSQLEKDPRLLWQNFVKFISPGDTTEMNDVQMAAQLPLWYHSAIQDGGHLQYFENQYKRLGDKLDVLVLATLDALKIVDAQPQAEILARAADLYFSKPRRHTCDPDELSQMDPEGEFEKFDTQIYLCSPGLQELLENYLQANLDSFIKIV